MNYIVYLTTNRVNNKIYIGVHKQHGLEFDGYIGCGITTERTWLDVPFHKAVKKYGYKNFIRMTISVFDNAAEAYALEARIVNQRFLDRKDTYNACPGGVMGAAGSNSKQIIQYSLSGKKLKVWESILDVTRYFTGDNSSRALQLSLDTLGKTCYGFQWRTYHEDSPEVIPATDGYKVPVAQYSLDGAFIISYKSCDSAGKSLGKVNGQAIKVAINKNNAVYGFQWVLDMNGAGFPDKIESWVDPRIIVQIDPSTNEIIKEWPNQASAREEFSNVSSVLKGKRKLAGGFGWMFKVDYINSKTI